MLLLGYFASRSLSAPLMEEHAVLAWLVALGTFFLATPVLLAVVASISSFSLRHARDELRRRLGQDDFGDAVTRLEEELAQLPEGNRGWVVLIRGRIVTAGEHVHVRIDLRNDEIIPTARIESVRGPRLNLFGDRIEDMSGWQRQDRELLPDESSEFHTCLSALGPDSMRAAAPGSRLWLNIALLRINGERTTTRCRVRINRPDQGGHGAAALVEEAWRLSGWDPQRP
jgi:hypothetical protein